MRDFLYKVYDKFYCFHGYTDMRLILGYESDGKGCARISFYIRGASPLISMVPPPPSTNKPPSSLPLSPTSLLVSLGMRTVSSHSQ